MLKTLAHTTYETIYSSDLQRTAKWYYKAFGFLITNINPDFAVVEIAPGRIICVHTQKNGPRKIGFISKNMRALKRQLAKADIPFETVDEFLMSVKDPDGNIIEIRGSGYQVEHLVASVPDFRYRNTMRCTVETRDEMHLAAIKITDDSEFDRASEELAAACKSEGISTEGEVFIVSEVRHTAEHIPGAPRATKVENIYACITITGGSDGKWPDRVEHLKIPPHDYTVYPVDYFYIDVIRSRVGSRHSALEWRSNFMAGCFTRPEGKYYILEDYKDDFIYLSIPYYWNKLNEEVERREEEKARNEESEVEQI